MAKQAATKSKPRTKSQIVTEIANATELTRKQVVSVFEAMAELIKKDLSKKGPGTFTVHGMVKLRVKDIKASPAKMGRNPRTGEPMEIPAKPARRAVRARALKTLSDMVRG